MTGFLEGAVVVQLDEDIPPIIVSPDVDWVSITNKPSLVTQAAFDSFVADVPEVARDALGAALVAGSNISIAVNDLANTLTVSAPTMPWTSVLGKPTFATVATTGSYDDLSNKPTFPSQAALDAVAAGVPEQARDAVGNALVAGAGITITVNDAGDSITITAPATSSYTDEAAMDAVAAMFAAGTHTGITFTYGDVANSLSASVAPAWTSVTGKPSFATVATSGSASDLTTGTLPAGQLPSTVSSHLTSTSNPHAVTKAQVGLGSVDNTADTAKPVSTAQQSALDAKAALSHTHGVTDLTATGTKNSTTFLRGDNTFAVPAGASDATTGAKGIVQLAGDLGGTAAAPLVVRRGPIGGHVSLTYAATITIDATTGNNFFVSATGNVAFAAPTGGVDGQQLMIEVYASGGARTVSFTGTTTVMIGLGTTIVPASGKVAYIAMRYSTRAGHWTVIALNAEA